MTNYIYAETLSNEPPAVQRLGEHSVEEPWCLVSVVPDPKLHGAVVYHWELPAEERMKTELINDACFLEEALEEATTRLAQVAVLIAQTCEDKIQNKLRERVDQYVSSCTKRHARPHV